MAAHINIIDTEDATIDEFIEEGGSIAEWQALPQDEKNTLITAAVQNRLDEGYWFIWSDGTVRDWTEN